MYSLTMRMARSIINYQESSSQLTIEAHTSLPLKKVARPDVFSGGKAIYAVKFVNRVGVCTFCPIAVNVLNAPFTSVMFYG